ncbi:hypothetical protein PF004_g1914 [Phytophthora fragariae]|uniref:Uncharacterized protein n=1 Tax=Phytophthora fragariae TaxID=53985 RepID=A0A6G0PQZ9_9STRA|nr:hypothetical protein PF004_g1914 [Phytophthora fragariae]
MRRNGLTIRRISHSGHKETKLLALRDAFACEVTKTTVDFVEVFRVPANGGDKGSYRYTDALLACGDGRMLPPHFVFAGESDSDVNKKYHCKPDVATFSVQSKAWFDERVMLECGSTRCADPVCSFWIA